MRRRQSGGESLCACDDVTSGHLPGMPPLHTTPERETCIPGSGGPSGVPGLQLEWGVGREREEVRWWCDVGQRERREEEMSIPCLGRTTGAPRRGGADRWRERGTFQAGGRGVRGLSARGELFTGRRWEREGVHLSHIPLKAPADVRAPRPLEDFLRGHRRQPRAKSSRPALQSADTEHPSGAGRRRLGPPAATEPLPSP